MQTIVYSYAISQNVFAAEERPLIEIPTGQIIAKVTDNEIVQCSCEECCMRQARVIPRKITVLCVMEKCLLSITKYMNTRRLMFRRLMKNMANGSLDKFSRTKGIDYWNTFWEKSWFLMRV